MVRSAPQAVGDDQRDIIADVDGFLRGAAEQGAGMQSHRMLPAPRPVRRRQGIGDDEVLFGPLA